MNIRKLMPDYYNRNHTGMLKNFINSSSNQKSRHKDAYLIDMSKEMSRI